MWWYGSSHTKDTLKNEEEVSETEIEESEDSEAGEGSEGSEDSDEDEESEIDEDDGGEDGKVEEAQKVNYLIEENEHIKAATEAARSDFLRWAAPGPRLTDGEGFFRCLASFSPCRMNILADIMKIHESSVSENAHFCEEFRHHFVCFLNDAEPGELSNWLFSLNVFHSRFLEALLGLDNAPTESKVGFFVDARRILFRLCISEGNWPLFMEGHILRLLNIIMGFKQT